MSILFPSLSSISSSSPESEKFWDQDRGIAEFLASGTDLSDFSGGPISGGPLGLGIPIPKRAWDWWVNTWRIHRAGEYILWEDSGAGVSVNILTFYVIIVFIFQTIHF